MVDTRVVLTIWLAAMALPGCASAPPAARWSGDLSAAKARAGADGLVVVRFIPPGRSRTIATEPAVDASAAVRARLRGHESVRLVAAEHGKTFRGIFDSAPTTATCVMDGRGLVVAARLGFVPPGEFVDLVHRAEDTYPLVATLTARLKALPMHGKRAATRQATFLLAEALLLSGNPYAAYRYFTLVTLLATDDAPSRADAIAAWERLARLEIDRGNPREAREWLGHLREEDSRATAHRGEVQLTEAMIALSERRVQDAHAILSELRADESNPEADRVWFEFGRACHESGREDDAARAFTTVLDRFPDSRWRAAAAAELSRTPAAAHRRQE